jgi:hypothetical protein
MVTRFRRQRSPAPQAPRSFRNFSRNRPETTNLNHQYAIRRVFIVPSSMLELPPADPMDNADDRSQM